MECVCVCRLKYTSCNAHALYRYLWPARLCCTFPHSLINCTIFEKEKVTEASTGATGAHPTIPGLVNVPLLDNSPPIQPSSIFNRTQLLQYIHLPFDPAKTSKTADPHRTKRQRNKQVPVTIYPHNLRYRYLCFFYFHFHGTYIRGAIRCCTFCIGQF
jgi:hypothetical protein